MNAERGAPKRSERPIGLSVWEQELYDHLTSHIESEGGLLDEYVALADQSGGHVKYLLEMISEDEARHHRLYEQWAETVKAMGVLQEAEDGIPALRPEPQPVELLDAVERLLAIEEDDERHLKKLRRELKDFEDTTLWPLLVDLMALDTAKHQKILAFLRRHARATARTAAKSDTRR